jgi:urea-proton symporter
MRIAKKHEGSYLTFKSDNGLVFAVDLLVAGFSTVWLPSLLATSHSFPP